MDAALAIQAGDQFVSAFEPRLARAKDCMAFGHRLAGFGVGHLEFEWKGLIGDQAMIKEADSIGHLQADRVEHGIALGLGLFVDTSAESGIMIHAVDVAQMGYAVNQPSETNESSTRFRPACSKSISSLLPSMTAIIP